MKYWRGFLVAGILGACTWGLLEFAKTHTVLIDMFFPYMSRMIAGGAASWSAGVPFCLWQVLLIGVVVGVLTLIALAVALRWNLLQVTGWITAVASLVVLLNTGIFGMNQYAGPLADDIFLNVTEYDFVELEDAATYYLNQAMEAEKALGETFPNFDALAEQAGNGFQSLVYNDSYSVFAGSLVPVKKLGWNGFYSGKGVTGVTVYLTGESAVIPTLPSPLLPFAICHEMAHRMSISSDRDANLAAFLACINNEDPYFIYSGYLNAYRYCRNALLSFTSDAAVSAAARLAALESATVKNHVNTIDGFYKNTEDSTVFRENVQLLVSWYIQDIYLPEHGDDKPVFDPMDEDKVDLNGFVNGILPPPPEPAYG